MNAAATLPSVLDTLSATPLREIVVADGGSIDQTTDLAAVAGAKIVAASRGRGAQLAAGAASASGMWLLFLHADCRPAPGWTEAVAGFVKEPQGATRAGYFDFSLDDAALAARRVERIVAWRCRVLALPYGDQGLLISRRLYDSVGGFARMPLMEDVDLVRRLGRQRLARIGVRCVTSARRYQQDGYLRRPLRNLLCLSLYFAGMPPERISRLYG